MQSIEHDEGSRPNARSVLLLVIFVAMVTLATIATVSSETVHAQTSPLRLYVAGDGTGNQLGDGVVMGQR